MNAAAAAAADVYAAAGTAKPKPKAGQHAAGWGAAGPAFKTAYGKCFCWHNMKSAKGTKKHNLSTSYFLGETTATNSTKSCVSAWATQVDS